MLPLIWINNEHLLCRILQGRNLKERSCWSTNGLVWVREVVFSTQGFISNCWKLFGKTLSWLGIEVWSEQRTCKYIYVPLFTTRCHFSLLPLFTTRCHFSLLPLFTTRCHFSLLPETLNPKVDSPLFAATVADAAAALQPYQLTPYTNLGFNKTCSTLLCKF